MCGRLCKLGRQALEAVIDDDNIVPFLIVALGAVIVGALVVVLAPRRARGAAMGAWVASPAFVYVAVIVYETLTRPPQAKAVENAFIGFMIISAAAIVPWLVVCGVGFALGFGIRRMLRLDAREPARMPAVAPAAPDPRIPPQPPVLEADGWTSVHVGFDGDDLRIDGHPIWRVRWKSLRLPHVRLPHPAHPAQIHDYEQYTIDGAPSTRFAAAELSNGVWGFYVPTPVPSDEPPRRGWMREQTSPSGDLHVEFEGVEWFNTHWVFSPKVTQTKDGHVLLDLQGTDWDAEATFPQAGQLALQFRRYRKPGLYATVVLDAPSGRYTLTPSTGSESAGDLADLPAALEALEP